MAPRLRVEQVRHVKWTHNLSRLSLQLIAKYTLMINDMIKMCPKVMLNCTFAVHWQRARFRHICCASHALTARYLLILLQCSFVYKMHPKEKTCSRGSVNTTAQPKTHTLSHRCVFLQVIYLAPLQVYYTLLCPPHCHTYLPLLAGVFFSD